MFASDRPPGSGSVMTASCTAFIHLSGDDCRGHAVLEANRFASGAWAITVCMASDDRCGEVVFLPAGSSADEALHRLGAAIAHVGERSRSRL